MKIAHITPVFLPYKSGMSNVVYQQCRELVKRGHEVTVVVPRTPNLPKPLLSKEGTKDVRSWASTGRPSATDPLIRGGEGGVRGIEEIDGIKVHRLRPWLWYSNAFLVPHVLTRLKEYDVVQLHYPFFGCAEWVVLAKKLGLIKKLVIYYHMDAHIGGFLGMVARSYERVILQRLIDSADRVMVSSLDYAKHSRWVSYFFSDRNKSKIIEVSLGVDLDRFKIKDVRIKITGLRERLKIENNSKVVLFVGGMDKAHYFKGVDVLLKAFKGVLKDTPEATLALVGDGDLRLSYEQLARELKIEERLKFVGHVSDEELPLYYHLSDVVVLPSINSTEAFGMVLLEAMACGKPVIASNLPGVRTLVEGWVNGYLVEAGNEEDLAEKLQMLLGSEQRRKQMGEAGLKKVNQYGVDLLGLRLQSIYEDSLDQ